MLAEYIALLNIVEGFNEQSLVIKGWSITIGMAALIAMYSRASSENGSRLGVLLAAFATVPFYLTDVLWKTFQQPYAERLTAMEEFVRYAPGSAHPGPLQSWSEWGDSYDEDKVMDFLCAMMNLSVLMPHCVIFAVGLLLAIFFPPNRQGRY